MESEGITLSSVKDETAWLKLPNAPPAYNLDALTTDELQEALAVTDARAVLRGSTVLVLRSDGETLFSVQCGAQLVENLQFYRTLTVTLRRLNAPPVTRTYPVETDDDPNGI